MAWAGVAVLCSVVALAQDAGAPAAPSQGQPATQTQGPRTDGQIEMDVVHALDASQALKNDLITAATIQSEVTLSGTVSSEASKQLAESIASHVAGVTKVHNNLTVGNPQDAQAMQPAPDAEAQEMPGNPQGGNGTAGLPAPGPAPDQNPPQAQYPAPAPYPQQQPYPPQRPPYQNPQYGQYPPQYGQYPPQYGQYPPQYGQYPPQYGQYPPQYPPAPQAPAYQIAKGPVTIPQGMLLQLRTSEAVDSKRAKDGEPVQFTVIQDVTLGGVLAIPRGATVHGVITESKNVGAGKLAGSSELALKLTSLDLGGRSYPLDSDEFKVQSPNKAGQTVASGLGGAIVGAIIGTAAGGRGGRGEGAGIGAGAGAGAGILASAASPGLRAWIPAEALVTFHLKAPVTVDPVSPQEAARLAQGLYPGGPSLYRRAYYPYRPYYAYPPVYYRPYYMDGGYYYWR